MKWEGERESSNVEDMRGAGGGSSGFGGLGGMFGGGGGGGFNFPIGGMRAGGGHMGIGGIVVIGLVMWFVFGVNPLALLGGMFGGGYGGSGYSQPSRVAGSPTMSDTQSDKLKHFSGTVLAYTEDVWTGVFQSMGKTYEKPKLRLYTGTTETGCGQGSEAMGPFYCPADRKVYLDLDFFNELSTRFGASGDFAQAYVIAHEVGHHVQNLLGISDQVDAARRSGNEAEANAASVKLELQADCFAGVWASKAKTHDGQSILEAGDIDEAMNAAAAVGDDTLQKKAQGYAVPETFTHGTSAQRQKWFKAGYQASDIKACDTFNAPQL